MQDGLEAVARDLVSLLRYQRFGGGLADKDACNHLDSRVNSPFGRRTLGTPRIGGVLRLGIVA